MQINNIPLALTLNPSPRERDFEIRLPSPEGRRAGDEGVIKMIFAGMLLKRTSIRFAESLKVPNLGGLGANAVSLPLPS
jgi:hypothetical protein